MIKRTKTLIIGIVISELILFTIAGLAVWSVVSHSNETVDRFEHENAELSERIADLQEPAEGGIETEAPALQTREKQDGRYRFPIAESDYITLTSPYGYRVSPILDVERYHQGVDIAATWNAQTTAVADGVVSIHYPPPGTPHPSGGEYQGHPIHGGYIVIEHPDGWTSAYSHLSWTRVFQGMSVSEGEVIGRVGDTGKSRGRHLHFALQSPEGEYVNPLLYISPDEEHR